MLEQNQEHNEIVNMYITRDKRMNIEPKKAIIDHLEKLGYLYIDIQNEITAFIKFNYKKNIDSLNFISYNDYNDAFINSPKYDEFKSSIQNRINRSVKLSSFNGTTLIEDFYNNCTVDELLYLGY